MHLREKALQYGATVMFTSSKAKESRNLDTLYQYLGHRLYNFNFTQKPQIVENDALFVPSGFDSLNLIQSLAKGSLTQGSYQDVLRSQYPDLLSSNKYGQQAAMQPTEEFLKSEDWQTLLQSKYVKPDPNKPAG